jgi:hypothetical protein
MEGGDVDKTAFDGRSLFVTQRGLIFDWQIDWCLTGSTKRSNTGLNVADWLRNDWTEYRAGLTSIEGRTAEGRLTGV